MFIKTEMHVRQRRWGDVGAGGRPVTYGCRVLATVFFGLSCSLGELLGPTKIAATISGLLGL